MTSRTKYRQRGNNRKESKKERKAKNKAKNKALTIVADEQTSSSTPYILPELKLPQGVLDLTERELLLLQMLSYKRPGGTKTEKAWIKKYITDPLEDAGHTVHEDWMGNHYVHVGDPEEHKTLFSSHCDTVHTTEGVQSIDYDTVTGMCSLQDVQPGFKQKETKPTPDQQRAIDRLNDAKADKKADEDQAFTEWRSAWAAKDGNADPADKANLDTMKRTTSGDYVLVAKEALVWDITKRHWHCEWNDKYYKSYREYEIDVGLPDSWQQKYDGGYSDYYNDYNGYSRSGYTGYGVKTGRECLGADDGTGVFIMVQMILEGVEGTYIFHREEETGGQGSNHIAQTQNGKEHKKNKSGKGKFMKQDPMGINDLYDHEIDLTVYDRAVAFDRKGTTDIITDQFGKCASPEFAAALAMKLNVSMRLPTAGPNSWKGCSGVFTDTANYTSHISECTNLSVGYYNQHGATEEQDVPFAIALLESCCLIDWQGLPTKRKLTDQASSYSWEWEDDYDYGTGYTGRRQGRDSYNGDTFRDTPYSVLPPDGFLTYGEALDVTMDYPEAVAELLLEWYSTDYVDSLNENEAEPNDELTIEFTPEEDPDPVG